MTCLLQNFKVQNPTNRTITSTIKRYLARVIDGKKISESIQSELKIDIDKWNAVTNKRPMLVAILVGDDPASATYVAHKMKVAKKVGVNSKTEIYPGTYSEKYLLNRIEALNADDSIDGILVQLPLPKGIDEQLICRSINPEKDVDGFSALNLGQVALGRGALVPCTPLGVAELLKRCNIATKGKHAVVVGRSKNVGLPIALLLQNRGFVNGNIINGKVCLSFFHFKMEQRIDVIFSEEIVQGLEGSLGILFTTEKYLTFMENHVSIK